MRPNRWIGLTLLSTLALGIGVGILLDRTILERVVHSGGADAESREGSDARARRWFKKLTSELDLSPEQQERLKEVLAKRHDSAHAFWSESRAEFEKLRQSFRRDIRELLNDEQRERYDEMLAAYDARRKNHDRH